MVVISTTGAFWKEQGMKKKKKKKDLRGGSLQRILAEEPKH